jgi:hypothetical protein
LERGPSRFRASVRWQRVANAARPGGAGNRQDVRTPATDLAAHRGGLSACRDVGSDVRQTAAVDILQKLQASGDERARDIPSKTLHSYCFSVLTGQAFIRASGRKARLLLEFERDYLLKDLEGSFPPNLTDRRDLLQAFVAAWARLQTDEPGQPVEGLDQTFQDAVLASLRWHQAMLIGEVVPLPSPTCVESGGPERQRYQRRPRRIPGPEPPSRCSDLLAGEGTSPSSATTINRSIDTEVRQPGRSGINNTPPAQGRAVQRMPPLSAADRHRHRR